jgi:hypothetical protein
MPDYGSWDERDDDRCRPSKELPRLPGTSHGEGQLTVVGRNQ